MGRKRRSSPALQRAVTRAANLRAISPTLDLGGDLTLAKLDTQIADFSTAQDEYNQLLATLDEKKNALEELEKALDDFNSRMLAGVAAHWGRNSSQYEQAGGTRTEERKRPARKKKPATS